VSVSSKCCVLSGRGLCVGLNTRPEKSYRVLLSVREASPTRDRQATEKINKALQYYDGQMKENIFDKTGRPTEELKVCIF
jgi:hypothetical protein